jgi:hypothetical protein
MFSIKTALGGLVSLAFVAGVHAQEKHLTLDDIDGLARQNIVDSMRKAPDAGKPPTSVGLNTSLNANATPAPDTSAPKAPVLKPSPPVKRSTPVSFVGAYSDASGSYALYDYQGAIYPAKQGTTLLNGWVLGRVDGFVVNVSEGKRKWMEVIAAQAPAPVVNSPGLQAISDLSGPLPANFPIGGSMSAPIAGTVAVPTVSAPGGTPLVVPIAGK